MASLDQIIADGDGQIRILFTYESVIKSLVQVKAEAENKAELYRQNLELLEPQVEKMRRVQAYADELIQTLVKYINTLLPQNKIPEADLAMLGRVLDTTLKLDYVKTWQPGLNNDFAMYRRSVQHVKQDYNMTEDESLRFFLVQPNNINKTLRDQLSKMEGIEHVLTPLVKWCIAQWEASGTDDYLRMCVYCIYLLDPLMSNPPKLTYMKKNVKLPKCFKTFAKNPRIQIYETLPFNLTVFLKNCPQFSEHASQDKGGCVIV